MAKKPQPKKEPSRALANLTPNAFTISVHGDEVLVPTNKDENTILNMVLASRMRSVIQKTMDDYKDDGVKFTPKELRDLAAAARDIASFSAEVYAASEPIQSKNGPPEPATDVTDISFDDLHSTPVVSTEAGDPPETLPS